MKTIGKLLKGVLDALLILVLVGALILLVAPSLMGAKLLVVLSQSMEPAIPMGAVVISQPTPANEVQLGDVITFRSAGPFGDSTIVTHRVIELVGSGLGVRFRTQGDAVNEPDPDLVQPLNLVGRVWFAVPWLGFLVAYLRTPVGFAFLVGMPAAWLVAGEVASTVRTLRGRKTKQAVEVPLDTGGEEC